jgi:DNA ligase-1
MSALKPQLAEDAILEAVRFPCWVQPKIDGVRAMNMSGRLTGRSLDPFKGFGITDYFSTPVFEGLDGEMILGNKADCSNRLCSMTTGAMGRFKGITEMADVHWYVFDFLTANTVKQSYAERYGRLKRRVNSIDHPRVHLVPYTVCRTLDELQDRIARNALHGFEGTIIRNPNALYKPGRATLKGQELWRVKPWSDAEIEVISLTQGEINGNEAKTNTLGRTERSSAKAGMLPNGQVGSIQGKLLADFKDPITGKLLFEKGLILTIGSGEMSVAEATHYWNHPDEIVGHVAKFKHMTHGVKDLPRFPTYMSHRLPQDM